MLTNNISILHDLNFVSGRQALEAEMKYFMKQVPQYANRASIKVLTLYVKLNKNKILFIF